MHDGLSHGSPAFLQQVPDSLTLKAVNADWLPKSAQLASVMLQCQLSFPCRKVQRFAFGAESLLFNCMMSSCDRCAALSDNEFQNTAEVVDLLMLLDWGCNRQPADAY